MWRLDGLPLAFTLPNLADPSIMAIGALVGGFHGGTYARFRRYPKDRVRELTADAGWGGAGFGLLLYLVVNSLGVP